MGLLRFKKVSKKEFDPLVEARRVFNLLGFDKLSSEAYIFGSAARDEFNPTSDIDVLLVFENASELKEAQNKLMQRPVSEWPFDWILKLRDDFDKRSEIGGVCFIAKKQGVRIK